MSTVVRGSASGIFLAVIVAAAALGHAPPAWAQKPPPAGAKPAAKPADKPGAKPDKPAEKPADKPAEKPSGAKPAEGAAKSGMDEARKRMDAGQAEFSQGHYD